MKKVPFESKILTSLCLTVFITLLFQGCTKQLKPSPYVAPINADIQLREDIVFLTATELAQKISTGQLTSLEVVNAYLSQIYQFNPKLNAIVTVNENARALAKAADEALARGERWGPLHGVPVTIKDQYATKGVRTTCGYPQLAKHIPDQDATVVARLKKAGAIILGKTNMPTLGMDIQTRNPIFGVTNNPWDPERTPGGSTGGGAAAVAAGLSPMEMGTDIGGSIRIPAHFCGIFGFKPTENMVSTAGLNPGLSGGKEYTTLRHRLSLGPLARSIDDLKLVLPIISGADVEDVDVPAIPIIYPETKPLNKLRIAWTDHFPGVPVSKDTRLAMEAFVERLETKGCTVKRVSPSEFGLDVTSAYETYYNLGDMELGIYMPTFMRFMAYAFGLKKHMVFPYSFEKYLEVLTKRDRIISEIEKFLLDWDVWICPVTSTPAFKHITPSKRRGPFPVYNETIDVVGEPVNYWKANVGHTNLFNLAGNPVITIPVGFNDTGLPIGVQVIGSRWQDARLITVAGQIFDAAGTFSLPPGYGREPLKE